MRQRELKLLSKLLPIKPYLFFDVGNYLVTFIPDIWVKIHLIAIVPPPYQGKSSDCGREVVGREDSKNGELPVAVTALPVRIARVHRA